MVGAVASERRARATPGSFCPSTSRYGQNAAIESFSHAAQKRATVVPRRDPPDNPLLFPPEPQGPWDPARPESTTSRVLTNGFHGSQLAGWRGGQGYLPRWRDTCSSLFWEVGRVW